MRSLARQSRCAAAGVLAATVLAGSTGCAPGAGAQTVVVYAAASLRPTFTEIADRFETEHRGTQVDFDFASAADLATQITQGAAADVFASADSAQMDKVVDGGLVEDGPVDFATNTLVIITAPGNPHQVGSFADLTKPGLAVVTSPPPMPCGVAIRQVEEATGIRLNPVSEEPDVEDVVNKVTTGQADAGLVNITDAIAAGDKVTTVKFPEAVEAVNTYPIATLRGAKKPELARAFVDAVTGQESRKTLAAAGFGRP